MARPPSEGTPSRSCRSSLLTVVALATTASAAAQGPDLVVGHVGSVTTLAVSAGRSALGVGATVCNVGDAVEPWDAGSAQHPVFVAALHRHEAGRFEPLGISWAFHEFGALNGAACATCTPPGSSSLLGAGCSTLHSASVAGSQGFLGARSDVDPTDGAFPMPFSGQGQVGGVLDKRLQVAHADLDPALHPGARYVLEVQYVGAGDAVADQRANNVSHREVLVSPGPGGVPSLSLTGPTFVGEPGLLAWARFDPGVLVSVVEADGRFLVASRATDNGDGTWHYELVLFDQDSARAAGSLHVPLPAWATVSNLETRTAEHHSGEVWDDAPWIAQLQPGGLSWSTTPHAQDPLAGALRWGTLASFRFDCDAPPSTGSLGVGLFAPGAAGAPDVLAASALLPDAGGTPGDVSCDPNGVHSGGTSGRLTVQGSTLLAAGDLTLVAQDLPANVFGYLLVSATPGLVSGPGGSQGDLCLGGTIGRYVSQVQDSGPTGTFAVPVDLGALPAPLSQPVLSGSTWIFQAWFRDRNPGPTSNFTSAQALSFL